ncbi:MAG: TonB-dependent receptor domain-containing protein, partial [Nostoc sp.]
MWRASGTANSQLSLPRDDEASVFTGEGARVALLEKLKFLIGGRFDIIGSTSTDLRTSTTSFQQDEAFTPRLGIVYQPIP